MISDDTGRPQNFLSDLSSRNSWDKLFMEHLNCSWSVWTNSAILVIPCHLDKFGPFSMRFLSFYFIWDLLGCRWEPEQSQCTMRFRKKRAKNVQLWNLVSPQIFIEKSWNFAQSYLNSSRIWGLFFWKKKIRKKCGEKSKNLLGVFVQVKIGLKKILSQKEFFLEKAHFAQTPSSSKKMGF